MSLWRHRLLFAAAALALLSYARAAESAPSPATAADSSAVPPVRTVAPMTPPTGGAPILSSGGQVTPPAEDAPKVEDIVLKARSFRGPEDKLNAVQSIRLEGEVFDGNGQLIGGLVQTLKKPASQRAETRREGRTNVSATDGFEAWLLVQHQDGRKTLTYITEPVLERFIDSGFEVLFPYRGPMLRRGGTTTLDGTVDFLAAKCWKVTFSYPEGLKVNCYFDVETGDLRGKTLGNDAEVFLEVGTLVVGDIRFPSELHTYRDGKLVNFTRFSKIEVNPPVDDRLFMAPSLTSLLLTAPPPMPAPPPGAGAGAPPPAPPSSMLPGGATLDVPPLAPKPEEQPQMFVPPPVAQ